MSTTGLKRVRVKSSNTRVIADSKGDDLETDHSLFLFLQTEDPMSIPEFPPNSDKNKQQNESKDIHRVTQNEPVRRKKSLRKQFQETLIAGDAKTAVRNVIFDTLIPAAQEMIIDGATTWVEKMVRGDDYRGRRRYSPQQQSQTPHIAYNRISSPYSTSAQRALTRRARATHDFDEIVLQTRIEAEEVIDQMIEIISRYGSASVADLYEMTGIQSAHTDNKWGWTDIRGAGVTRDRRSGGFLLDLPEPKPFS